MRIFEIDCVAMFDASPQAAQICLRIREKREREYRPINIPRPFGVNTIDENNGSDGCKGEHGQSPAGVQTHDKSLRVRCEGIKKESNLQQDTISRIKTC